MTKETFEKELALCRKLYRKQKGCHWGMCVTCGVIPLLYKLHHDVVLETEEDIKKVKEDAFEEKI